MRREVPAERVAYQVFASSVNGWLWQGKDGQRAAAIAAADREAARRDELCYAVDCRTGNVFHVSDPHGSRGA